MRIKVMTFNIQHCLLHAKKPEKVIDFAPFSAHIRAAGADFIGLQEVRSAGSADDYRDQPAEVNRPLGMTAFFGFAKQFPGGPYGNAFLTSWNVLETEVVSIPIPDGFRMEKHYEDRCVIRALLERDGCRLTALVSHFGLHENEQTAAVDAVLRLSAQIDTPIVLMGDFNVLPDDPQIARLKRVFTDTADWIEGDGLTFPSDAPDRKIDYIFVRGARVLSAQVVPGVVSDHCAMTAELELT